MNSEQDSMLRNIYNAIFFGGPSMEDSNRSISRSLAMIHNAVYDNPDTREMVQQISNAVFAGGPSMEDNGQSISRSLAQINAKPTVEISEADLDNLANLLVQKGVGGASVEEISELLKSLTWKA